MSKIIKYYDTPRFLQDGTAMYPFKKRGEPPPAMEGYRRRGTNFMTIDAWIFIPLWMDCEYRRRELIQRDAGCKCVRIVMSCAHPKQILTERLKLVDCEKCVLRQLQEKHSLVQLSNCESISESIVMGIERNIEPIAKREQSETLEGDILSSNDRPISDTKCE